jgi:hypothetical protein
MTMSSTDSRGRWSGIPDPAGDRLVRQCALARAQGVSFTAVWSTILKPSRLTIGHPIQTFEDGKPVLRVRLVTNQCIVCRPDGYSLG